MTVAYGHAHRIAVSDAEAGRRLKDPNTPQRPVRLLPIPQHLRPTEATR